jgi:hypothetical protein
VNALASRAEEGRGKTAISLGLLSSKLNRGFPNGATHPGISGIPPAEHISREEVSGGSETSQYPEENRKTFNSPSSGERTGMSLNLVNLTASGPMFTGCRKADMTKPGIGRGVKNQTLVKGPWKGPP